MNKITTLLIVLFSLTASCVAVAQPIKASSEMIVVPDDYSTIQDAVDNASSGDTVFVKNGTYNESVSITKSLSLVGEDKAKTIIVGGWRLGGTVVLVSHDSVTINGFTIQSNADNTHGGGIRGVHLLHVRCCTVFDCIFLGNGVGVWLYGSSDNIIENNYIKGEVFSDGSTLPNGVGIQLQDSSYNNILGNMITDTTMGVMLSTSIGNNLTGNHITTHYGGIILSFSDNNTISSNTVTSLRYGIRQSSSSHNMITDNNLTGNPTGIQISSSSYFNLVEENVIASSRYCGLELHDNASHNMILGNNITNNKYGLEIKSSSYNTLRDNDITGNTGIAAIFVEASANLVHKNNFINNALHAANEESINTWDADGKGNYWDNYTDTDVDNDGLGESPYVIDESNRDNYPLMRAPEMFPTSTPSPSPSEEYSPLPGAQSEPESFPTDLAVVITGIAIASVGLLVYFRKSHRLKKAMKVF